MQWPIGFLGFSYLSSPSAAFRVVAKDIFSTFSSYSLSVIPMFVWMGFLAFYSGIGSRLYDFAYKLAGHLRGGLAIATQATCALFGAVCGSNTATAATIGAIALPEMENYQYAPALSTASGAGGPWGLIPKRYLYCYGIATERHRKLFWPASFLILLMLLYMATISILLSTIPPWSCLA